MFSGHGNHFRKDWAEEKEGPVPRPRSKYNINNVGPLSADRSSVCLRPTRAGLESYSYYTLQNCYQVIYVFICNTEMKTKGKLVGTPSINRSPTMHTVLRM